MVSEGDEVRNGDDVHQQTRERALPHVTQHRRRCEWMETLVDRYHHISNRLEHDFLQRGYEFVPLAATKPRVFIKWCKCWEKA